MSKSERILYKFLFLANMSMGGSHKLHAMIQLIYLRIMAWHGQLISHASLRPLLGGKGIYTLRNEQSMRFADVYYISPAGIKIRSKKEVERYLEDNPDYAADLHLSQFSFKVPKPPNCPRQSELIEPTEVPPPVHEDPVHNYMPVPHGEANPVTHIPVTLALQVSVMLSKKRKLNQ
uniref:MBD domain-containing protein n=1 Tax=Triticum urartu TaxID=4572 RepID=A0A8R7V6S3_TRIUA